jgi:tRNA(Ile)-lysidine synthase
MIALGGRRLRRLRGGRVVFVASSAGAGGPGPFSYTLPVPGEVAVPELGGVMRLTRCAVEPWMRRGETSRAALSLPDPPPRSFAVRNRRPGDRLRPLGAPGMRGLKELLIDRKVPRCERDRIPLLIADGRIAWVPGITIDDTFRLREGVDGGDSGCWLAEWLPDRKPPAPRSTFKRAAITRPEDEDT